MTLYCQHNAYKIHDDFRKQRYMGIIHIYDVDVDEIFLIPAYKICIQHIYKFFKFINSVTETHLHSLSLKKQFYEQYFVFHNRFPMGN